MAEGRERVSRFSVKTFCLAVAKNFAGERFCAVVCKTYVNEKTYRWGREGGEYQDFPLNIFFSQCQKVLMEIL